MKRAVYQKWYALLSHISNVKQLLFSLISAFLCNAVLLGSIQFIHSTYYSYTQASSTLINSYLACQFTDIWLPSNLSLFSEFLEQKSVGDRLMYAFLWFPFLSRSAAGTCSFCGGARVLQQATRPHQIFLTEQILRKEQLSWKGTQMYLAEIMKVRLFLWLLLGAVHTL